MKTCLRCSLKPFAMLLLVMVFAMVATRNILYSADETIVKKTTIDKKRKQEPDVYPEVLVTGETKGERSYKPGKVSSTKYTGPLRDIPKTITVIPQAVMQDQGATTLRESLRTVPGISMQAGEGGVPAGDNLSIRGFNARTDIFVDGVRDFGGYTRDSFNLEQVEIVKGPASSYTGRGSTGGSINQVSKSPELDPSYDGSVGFGSAYYKRTTLDFNQPLTGMGIDELGAALRVDAMWHDSNVPRRDEVENTRWGVAPSLALGLGTPTRVKFSYFYLGQDNMPDYGLPWIPSNNLAFRGDANMAGPADTSNFYGLKGRDYENTATHIVTGEIEHDFNDSLTFRNLIRYGNAARDSVITAPRFVNTASGAINRQLQSRDQVDTVLDNQTEFITKFETFDLEHSLTSGFEYVRENSDNRLRNSGNAPFADYLNPNPKDFFDSFVTSSSTENEATSDSHSFYAFDTIKINDYFDINGGVRWEYFGVTYEPIDSPSMQRIDRPFSWNAGLVYKPVEIGSIYFGYGTSFNPSAEGLSLGNTATSTNSITLGPEQSQTYELGTKWDLFNEKLSVNTAIFRTEKTNARTEDPANAGDIIALDGKQRVHGWELGANGDITEDWKVFTAYTLLGSRVTKSNNPQERGNEISNTPGSTFSLWTTYMLPLNFEVGGGLQFVGKRYSSSVTDNATNSRKMAPAYWLMDLMAAYHVNERITLRANFYNVTDQEYIDRVGGGHYIPGQGRSVVVSTDFDF